MIPLNSRLLKRLPPLTGLAFGVAAFARGGGDGSGPTTSSTGAQISDYASHHTLAAAAYHLELWMFLSLMVFTLVLYARLRAAEPAGAIAAKVAVAACVVAVTIKLSSFPAVYALYSSPMQVDPGAARPLWVIGWFAFVVSMLVEALSMAAIAFSGLVHGGIPRWLAATAGAVAVSLVAGFTLGASFQTAPTLAWMAWMVVAGVALALREPRNAGQAAPAPVGLSTRAAV